MKRQQAFIASMAHQVVTAGTLARPDRLMRFLDAATKSLTVDPGLKNLAKIAELGNQFKNIGLDKIQFITIPISGGPARPQPLVWAAARPTRLWDEDPQRRAADQAAELRRDQRRQPPGRDQAPEQRRAPSATRRPSPSGSPTVQRRPAPPRTRPSAQALANAGPVRVSLPYDAAARRDRLAAPPAARRGLRRRAARTPPSDERDDEPRGQREAGTDAWLRAQVPPHHGELTAVGAGRWAACCAASRSRISCSS